MSSLIEEKLSQAQALLDALGIDAWLTFVRETSDGADPVLPLILGRSLTWQSALILTKAGGRIAIVGTHDAQAVESVAAWTEVRGYVQSIRQPLVEALTQIDPQSIALNFSTDNVKADGLSHGMFLLLRDYLKGTAYADRFISAADLIRGLRGRKSPGEVQRIRQAIASAQAIFDSLADHARIGMTERQIADFMHEQAAGRGLGLAWDPQHCPIVNTGPDSMGGHGIPSEALSIQPGRILQIDFGVRENEYCSDLQRAWYIPASGESRPPGAVQRAFDTIVRAIRAAADVMRPGVECWQVDAAARQIVIDAGYPEYDHATGHEVGRAAHDGGGVLGPKWERYGRTPMYRVEPGNVFTLELGIPNVDGRGYLGLEEMVLVTEDGIEWLSEPQTELPVLEL